MRRRGRSKDSILKVLGHPKETEGNLCTGEEKKDKLKAAEQGSAKRLNEGFRGY
jgi:hypothetical protein